MKSALDQSDIFESQSEFLGEEKRAMLNRMFGGKRVGSELKVEIGLQWLRLRRKEIKETKNGGWMICLSFYKSPKEFPQLRSKVSYSTIDCYHILQPYKTESFKDNWYKKFTACLDEESFEVIKKGDTYLCLVQQTERPFEKGGEIMVYEKGRKAGDEITLIEPEIVKVYPPDTDIEKLEINYFELYKTLE